MVDFIKALNVKKSIFFILYLFHFKDLLWKIAYL